MGALDVVVAVPGAVVELDEADPFFDELAGQEAFASERIRSVLSDAVHLFGLLVLLG